ncbi:hypothetical protein F4X73_06455 [Candidatus Poribacteria bacterium]|nr:hypothetical protein [Candidatus Poribacteria bacterium]MYB64313.1 hypothetical protein [Candidatus Poribacteria bacterium]MYF57271.1 hypothetical protein [Candidatus Poribacteria bacterium]
MANSENTITSAFVNVLRNMRDAWSVNEQITKPFLHVSQKPDVIVTETGRNPIVIEVKIDGKTPNLSGMAQAAAHFGMMLDPNIFSGITYDTVENVLRIRMPARFKTMPQGNIDAEMRTAEDIAYMLINSPKPENEPEPDLVPFTYQTKETEQDNEAEPERFPKEGWLKGSVADIATAIRVGSTPISKINAAADLLEARIEIAAKQLETAIAERPSIGQEIEGILFQKSGEQTSRMAMLIITNAFVFQSALAGKPEMKDVLSLKQMLSDDARRLRYDQVRAGWNVILNVNYRPIFYVAKRLIEAIATDDELIDRVLAILCRAARELVDQRLTQVHELAGTVFQRLIVDRKYIKANYTRLESASLLSALVLPKSQEDLSELKVADFACGTGSLLNGVYQRILELHEQAGSNGSSIHIQMIENNLVGCDILPNASHLTASLLTSTYPDLKIGNTRIYTMPYGRQKDGIYALGALDLFDEPEATIPLPMMGTEIQQVGGEDDLTVVTEHEFQHNEFDIVVLNPPFTRPDSDASSGTPKAVFRGSDREKEEEQNMRQARKRKKWRVGNGNAGLASDFVDLADKMLKENGKSRMGFILPITCLAVSDWKNVRNLWATEYHDVVVLTIADAKAEDCAFSADTSMAECMVVATKGKKENNTGRGTFISLSHRPQSVLEAIEIANIINKFENLRRLEDEPSGGKPLKVGEEIVGHALNCPLQIDRSWDAVRIKEMALIQSAHRLANGEMWLPTQAAPLEIPICLVNDIAKISASHRDIFEKSERGAFDIEKGCTDTDLYPGLWHLNAPAQRAMVVEPDCHAIPRPNRHEKAQMILTRSGRVHFNVDIGFSANSLGVFFTEKPSLGISSLPNVVFEKLICDYVWTLWGNSTLGLLLHWAHSGKQQPGRGRGSRTSLLQMPTLDVRCLSNKALANAERIFHDLKHKRMLPFNELDHDPVRHELDRRLLNEVLDITSKDAHNAVHRLRELLCAEPSIHGGKKSKCNLEKELGKLNQ